jgi:hypothetical protein
VSLLDQETLRYPQLEFECVTGFGSARSEAPKTWKGEETLAPCRSCEIRVLIRYILAHFVRNCDCFKYMGEIHRLSDRGTDRSIGWIPASSSEEGGWLDGSVAIPRANLEVESLICGLSKFNVCRYHRKDQGSYCDGSL